MPTVRQGERARVLQVCHPGIPARGILELVLFSSVRTYIEVCTVVSLCQPDAVDVVTPPVLPKYSPLPAGAALSDLHQLGGGNVNAGRRCRQHDPWRQPPGPRQGWDHTRRAALDLLLQRAYGPLHALGVRHC